MPRKGWSFHELWNGVNDDGSRRAECTCWHLAPHPELVTCLRKAPAVYARTVENPYTERDKATRERRRIENMPLIASARGSYTPPPEGLYHSVCCDVIDLGIVTGDFGPLHKIKIVHQTEDINPATKAPYVITRNYTFSLHAKSSLLRDLVSWRGKAFTPKELEGFDLEKLIGANSQINIIHQLGRDGSMMGVLSSIVPPAKKSAVLKVAGYVRKPWATVAAPAPAPVAPPSTSVAPPPADDDVPF